MAASLKYNSTSSVREKILYVLSTLEKASIDEMSMEIMELDGIATEEGVADTTIEIENEVNRLCHDGIVNKLKEHRQKVRYVLARLT